MYNQYICLYLNKKAEIAKTADGRDVLHNVANNAACYQIYVANILLIF